MILVILDPIMPSSLSLRPDETARRRFTRAGWTWACALLALGLSGGCATPPLPVSNYTPLTAVVRVENHTDWPWRIAFIRTNSPAASTPRPTPDPAAQESTADEEVRWLSLTPRENLRVDLRGGIYRVRREVLRPPSDPMTGLAPASEVEPDVSLWLVPGRSYTWPLATLFSTEEGAQ